MANKKNTSMQKNLVGNETKPNLKKGIQNKAFTDENNKPSTPVSSRDVKLKIKPKTVQKTQKTTKKVAANRNSTLGPKSSGKKSNPGETNALGPTDKESLNTSIAVVVSPDSDTKVEDTLAVSASNEKQKSLVSLRSDIPKTETHPFYDDEIEEESADENSRGSALFQSSIPYLPIEFAILCFICNILVPGLGSILCGMFTICCGKMQAVVKKADIPMKFFLNFLVGIMQFSTFSFFLVGWFWSIGWGLKILLLSIEHQKRNKRIEERRRKMRPKIHIDPIMTKEIDDSLEKY